MKFNLNLASRRYVNKQAIFYGFVAVFCVALLLVGLKVNTLVASNNALQLNQQHLNETRQRLQVLRGGPIKTLSADEREAIEKEFLTVADLLSLDAFRWTALLDRMEKILPAGVSLSAFRPDYKKNSLNLSGEAQNLKKMRKFLDRLLKDESFDQVYLKSHARTTVLDAEGLKRGAISFTLQLEGVF